MADNLSAPRSAGDSLAMAVVLSSFAPTLLLDSDLTVMAASSSFCRAFAVKPETAIGQPIFSLGAGEWDVPQLRSLLSLNLTHEATVDAYEMDLVRAQQPARRLVITAQALDYGDPFAVRILMVASDVTDARLAARLREDLLHEKALLHAELQHRVANSLQIIASVLMRNARRVPSPDARRFLVDAHRRVMSVATLQRQLAKSSEADVGLRAYFTDLCASIDASMIEERDQLTLRVDSDEGSATADVSVSLGLIVTELVINALKHAFPAQQQGNIVVGYSSRAADWLLTVTDDGVGMPPLVKAPHVGLGTTLVRALAKQIGATVTVSDAKPGTSVAIRWVAKRGDPRGSLSAR